jgi:hypothetical protein
VIAFSRELLCEVMPEAGALLEQHYRELAKNQDRVRLAPDWTRYGAAEAMGQFVVFTVRDAGELVGYAGFFCSPHPHYIDLHLCSNDVLFLRADHRVGRTGVRFIRFCEQQLAARHATPCITWHAKEATALASMLGRMGYQTQDIVFSKLLF